MSTVQHLEVIVEEPSTQSALQQLLPRILGPITFRIHAHQGKTDLLSMLPHRLQGYARFLRSNSRILVVVDRDDDDCTKLKARMEKAARGAGLPTRSTKPKAWTVVNRIAVEEMEAWFFGDWNAVKAAYPRVLANADAKAKYRNPDAIRGGTWEALERLLQKAGYLQPACARAKRRAPSPCTWIPPATARRASSNCARRWRR